MKRNIDETFEAYKTRRSEDKVKTKEYLKGKLIKPMGTWKPDKMVIPVLKFDDPVVLKEHRILRKKRNKASYKSLRCNKKKG